MKKNILLAIILSIMIGCVQETKNLETIPADKLDSNWWNERHQKVIEHRFSQPLKKP